MSATHAEEFYVTCTRRPQWPAMSAPAYRDHEIVVTNTVPIPPEKRHPTCASSGGTRIRSDPSKPGESVAPLFAY